MEMKQLVTINRDKELEELISVYGEKLLRYATSILYSHQDAEDVVQDVFISYFQNSGRFDIRNRSAWLYKMTYNHCLNKLKEVKRRRLFFFEHTKNEPVTHMEDRLSMPEIMKALKRLTPQERALLYGRAMNEQSYEELSQIMGSSAAALRKQYERVKKKAVQYLNACGYNLAESLYSPIYHISGKMKGVE
ncbi:MAG: sigma-70 family RNA polymerase sigma factor [Clostridiales bacterium]|nr:sigma-70 family RNA polymerase sigma factor [Clostridiales bacterium]